MRSLKNKLTKKKNLISERDFHDEWAESVSVLEANPFTQFKGLTSPEYKKVAELMGKVHGMKILNLGCGLGEEAIYFASKGAKVWVIDISSKMLEFTKSLSKKYNVANNIVYRQMSAEKLDFPQDSFDAVIGCNILHHVNISKTLKKVKRVLKPNGIAVFSEPLDYNPAINIYRAMANKVRTDNEHPITYGDLDRIREIFPNLYHSELQLFTLLIFVWFFIGERLHPNSVRYWKKIIIEANKYKKIFSFLNFIDSIFLKVFPFFRKYCWVIVMKMRK